MLGSSLLKTGRVAASLGMLSNLTLVASIHSWRRQHVMR